MLELECLTVFKNNFSSTQQTTGITFIYSTNQLDIHVPFALPQGRSLTP